MAARHPTPTPYTEGRRLIVLATDFGLEGPYVGQMKAVLHRAAPGVAVVDLCHDLGACDPRAAAYLLPAYCGEPFPPGAVFLCVVDPGVGTERPAVAATLDGRWFVGPDNGLFALLVRRAAQARAWRLDWRPQRCSATFHGRDLFAPVAAALALARPPGHEPAPDAADPRLKATPLPPSALDRPAWPDQHAAVIYADRFGNLMTGLAGAGADPARTLRIGRHRLAHARTFGLAPAGGLLWTVNANGLVEICANGTSAARLLGLEGLGVGAPVAWEPETGENSPGSASC